MCGIVGYIGPRQAPQVIMHGLKRLEYRGYDSAGVAVLERNGHIAIRRDRGKLSNLESMLVDSPLTGHVGIGHTRWATHGLPSRRNAHPHVGEHGRIVLVHNGIVENYQPLRKKLADAGTTFASDTDTEVIVQLIESRVDDGVELEVAFRESISDLEGANAVVAMSVDDPDHLWVARTGHAGGITIGFGEDEMFLASDIPAILEYTREVCFLESGQMAAISRQGIRLMDLDGRPIQYETHQVAWDPVSAEKGEFKHFMQKEIFDQPRALIDTIGGRVDIEAGCVELPDLNLSAEDAVNMTRLIIVACGTSYYAGLAGKYMIETLAQLPVEVEYASEFRYKSPLVDESTAVLSITQSGETADTLAASDLARSKGARLWSIVNVIGSQSMRMSDGFISMQAGPEIGVASTKAFTTSLVDLYLLGCRLGTLRGTLDPLQLRRLVDDVVRLPALAGRVLEMDKAIESLANELHKAEDFLFLGRGINYPIALEGALKLKEISYIHAEGYPAGEMKHGPIALIDEEMPILAIVTKDHLYEKMISQVRQSKARGGIVIALATEGDEAIGDEVDHVVYVPEVSPLLAPVINVLPLQLLSYHIGVRRGCDVDQPRNLAKSVTVE